jgi:hypothetical protein
MSNLCSKLYIYIPSDPLGHLQLDIPPMHSLYLAAPGGNS